MAKFSSAILLTVSISFGALISSFLPKLSTLISVFENDKVYVIWMDVPSTPYTPGFDNIRKNDYQLRYWSIGHYMWEMKLNNPRPVLSTLMDQDTIKIKQKKSERVCILLCSAKQYEILHEQGKLNNDTDKKVTWLNWGQTKQKNMVGSFTDYKDEWEKMNEDDITIVVIKKI